MLRTFIFLIGFGFMVIGLTYIITYLNLLSMGYSFLEYFNFILKRSECLITLIGFVLVTVIILTKGDSNDLHI